MPSRLKDLEGAREVTLDATSQEGRVYLMGKGFAYEFDRGMFERWLEREMGMPRSRCHCLSRPDIVPHVLAS